MFYRTRYNLPAILAGLCLNPLSAQLTPSNSNIPRHLTFADGALYIADAEAGRIFKVDQAGNVAVVAGSGWADVLSAPLAGHRSLAIDANLVKPTSVAVDSSGNVYFADSLGVHKVDANGKIGVLPGTGCLSYDSKRGLPLPLALNASGTTLYCVTAVNRTGAVVSQVDLLTLRVKRLAGGGSAAERLSSVNGLAVSASGDVYAASANQIYKISGGRIARIAANLPNVADLAVDNAGNLFVSALDEKGIYRMDAATHRITQLAGGGEAAGLAVDTSTNDLYFLDSSGESKTVAKFNDGTNHLVRRISTAAGNLIQTLPLSASPETQPGAPTVVSLSPTSGTGTVQAFTAVYSDPNGVADLKDAFLLINAPFGAASSCYVAYTPATNFMYLVSDDGTEVLSTAVAPGSSASVGNSQCLLSGAGSSVSTSGNNLTLSVALSFFSGFAGTKSVFLDAVGQTASSGWVQEGTWTPATAGPPSIVSESPSSGAGATQNFGIEYLDPSGAGDLRDVFVLFNSTLQTSNACYVVYAAATNRLYLYNDAGTAVLPTAISPSAAGSVSNSQCTLNGGDQTYVDPFSDSLGLYFNLTFSGTFLGQKNIYEFAAGKTQNSGWVQKGAWDTSPPIIVSESPNSGTGLTQTFTTVYSDPVGISDLNSVSISIGELAQATDSCFVNYLPATNQMQLVNDAGTAFLPTTVIPGTATSVSNSQCTLNGTGSSVVISGNNLALNAALTFAGTFYGSQHISADAMGKTASSLGAVEGSWIPAPYPPPSIVSLTPNSGTGLSQTFSIVYSDVGSYLDLVYVLINNTFSPGDACYFEFDGNGNVFFLENDAGTGLLPTTTDIGFSIPLSNSQCSLDGLDSSKIVSGNTTTLNVAVIFSGTFTGQKNVYVDVVHLAPDSSGWVQMGAWTP